MWVQVKGWEGSHMARAPWHQRPELRALVLLLNTAAEFTYAPRKYMSEAHSVLGTLPGFGDRGGQSPDFMEAAVQRWRLSLNK